MKFELGKYTEITDLYKKHSSALQEGDKYIRFFICLDVNDIWLIRVMEDINSEYEEEIGAYLLERNNIPKESRSDNLTIPKVIEIIKNDEFDNWDIEQYEDIDSLIEDIDGGFGLN